MKLAGGRKMEKIKSLTIRINAEKWQKAKVKMLLEGKGRTFQDICEEAIDRYVEESDDKEKNK